MVQPTYIRFQYTTVKTRISAQLRKVMNLSTNGGFTAFAHFQVQGDQTTQSASITIFLCSVVTRLSIVILVDGRLVVKLTTPGVDVQSSSTRVVGDRTDELFAILYSQATSTLMLFWGPTAVNVTLVNQQVRNLRSPPISLDYTFVHSHFLLTLQQCTCAVLGQCAAGLRPEFTQSLAAFLPLNWLYRHPAKCTCQQSHNIIAHLLLVTTATELRARQCMQMLHPYATQCVAPAIMHAYVPMLNWFSVIGTYFVPSLSPCACVHKDVSCLQALHRVARTTVMTALKAASVFIQVVPANMRCLLSQGEHLCLLSSIFSLSFVCRAMLLMSCSTLVAWGIPISDHWRFT